MGKILIERWSLLSSETKLLHKLAFGTSEKRMAKQGGVKGKHEDTGKLCPKPQGFIVFWEKWIYCISAFFHYREEEQV